MLELEKYGGANDRIFIDILTFKIENRLQYILYTCHSNEILIKKINWFYVNFKDTWLNDKNENYKYWKNLYDYYKKLDFS